MTVSDAFAEPFTPGGLPRRHAAALVGELECPASVAMTRLDPSTTARA